MKHVSRKAINIGALALLIYSARRARTQEVNETEEKVFRAFNDKPNKLHPPVWAVMQSGSLAAVFVASAELLRQGHKRSATAALVTGVSVWGGVKAVKPLVGRGRPDKHLSKVEVRGQQQTGLGYPSGHAAVSTALALVVTRDKSPAVRLAALSIAGATSAARMYVGAHLPLDAVGGIAIGTLCGRAANRTSSIVGVMLNSCR